MATFYNPSIISDSLCLYYDMANTKSYPGSGSSIFDLTRNNKTATLAGSYSYESDNRGNILFGSVAYFSVSPSGIFPASGVTIESWVKESGGTFFNFWINETQMMCMPTSIARRWYNNNSTQIPNTETFSSSLSNNYRHIAWTIGSLNDQVYMNGDPLGPNRNTTISNPTITGINGAAALIVFHSDEIFTNNYSPTNLGIYRIYNRVLSAEEIKHNFNAQRMRFGL